MSKAFLQKLRIATTVADDLLTLCDASDLLDGLEVARDFMFEAASVIEKLESRLAQVERERDAAVADMRMAFRKCNVCCTCKYEEVESNDCMDCIGTCNWEWRGVCAENTEEDAECLS